MLKVDSLKKVFKAKKLRVNALNGVSFILPDTGLIFILGKSGSGKSTLLHLLGGLDRPTSGSITVDGEELTAFSERQLNAYRNKYVGFVFQEYNLMDGTVGKNISLAMELQGEKASRDAVEALLKELDLAEGGQTLYDRKVNELSGGQKQRVAIARALIKQPKLILADEPTGALDSDTGEELYKIFKRLSKDRLVVVVTHDRECAERYGDRVIELKDGKLLSDSAPYAEPTQTPVKVAAKHYSAGRLPAGRTIALGLSGLKYKKFRLALSVLLAVITFSVLGFSMVAADVGEIDSELSTAYDNDLNYIEIVPDSPAEYEIHYESGIVINGSQLYTSSFTDKQLNFLEESAAVLTVTDFDSYGYYARSGEEIPLEERYNPYNNFGISGPIKALVEVSPQTGEEDASLTPDPRLTVPCRLPQNYSEIAITDYAADMFMRFGYKDADGDGTEYEITSPDDLIGKTINGLTICGVYQTEEDKERFKDNYDYANPISEEYAAGLSDDLYMDEYYNSWSRGQHSLSYGFVMEGYWGGSVYKLLFRLSGSEAKDRDIIDGLFYDEDQVYEGSRLVIYQTVHFGAALNTRFSGFARSSHIGVLPIEMLTDETFVKIASYVGIALAVFSILLFTNFLLVNIDARKNEMGILRAMGASAGDTIGICLVESMAIAAIDFILSIFAVAIICGAFNAAVHFNVFIINALPVLALFLLCLGVALIATAIPVIKLTRKRPIEIINNK